MADVNCHPFIVHSLVLCSGMVEVGNRKRNRNEDCWEYKLSDMTLNAERFEFTGRERIYAPATTDIQ